MEGSAQEVVDLYNLVRVTSWHAEAEHITDAVQRSDALEERRAEVSRLATEIYEKARAHIEELDRPPDRQGYKTDRFRPMKSPIATIRLAGSVE